MWNTT
jgi:hypothetical protein